MRRVRLRRRLRLPLCCRAHGVVLRLRMVHDHRRRALLGDELERGRQLHSERLFRRQQLEELRVILEIRTRAVAPRVALAATAGDPELATDAAMQPFRHRFRALDRESVLIERLAVLAGRLLPLEPARRLVADGDDLERHDVDVADSTTTGSSPRCTTARALPAAGSRTAPSRRASRHAGTAPARRSRCSLPTLCVGK